MHDEGDVWYHIAWLDFERGVGCGTIGAAQLAALSTLSTPHHLGTSNNSRDMSRIRS